MFSLKERAAGSVDGGASQTAGCAPQDSAGPLPALQFLLQEMWVQLENLHC